MDDDIAAAFDMGADSDEIHEKKGSRKKHGNKKKNKKNVVDVADSDEEEEKHDDEDQDKDPKNDAEYPLEVVYCGSK